MEPPSLDCSSEDEEEFEFMSLKDVALNLPINASVKGLGTATGGSETSAELEGLEDVTDGGETSAGGFNGGALTTFMEHAPEVETLQEI